MRKLWDDDQWSCPRTSERGGILRAPDEEFSTMGIELLLSPFAQRRFRSSRTSSLTGLHSTGLSRRADLSPSRPEVRRTPTRSQSQNRYRMKHLTRRPASAVEPALRLARMRPRCSSSQQRSLICLSCLRVRLNEPHVQDQWLRKWMTRASVLARIHTPVRRSVRKRSLSPT